MTFESLAVAGLSIGLSMDYILDFNIGLTIGILNEKTNQYLANKKQSGNNDDEDTVIQGDAKMLMNM